MCLGSEAETGFVKGQMRIASTSSSLPDVIDTIVMTIASGKAETQFFGEEIRIGVLLRIHLTNGVEDCSFAA